MTSDPARLQAAACSTSSLTLLAWCCTNKAGVQLDSPPGRVTQAETEPLKTESKTGCHSVQNPKLDLSESASGPTSDRVRRFESLTVCYREPGQPLNLATG